MTLNPLAVDFEDRWWQLQTSWIQMRPHITLGLIWDPKCLTLRLYIYIGNILYGNNEFLQILEEKRMEKIACKVFKMREIKDWGRIIGQIIEFCMRFVYTIVMQKRSMMILQIYRIQLIFFIACHWSYRIWNLRDNFCSINSWKKFIIWRHIPNENTVFLHQLL